MLFNVEEHFKKILMQYWISGLQSKGILKIFVRNSADRPVTQNAESFNASLARRIMTVILRVWRVNNL